MKKILIIVSVLLTAGPAISQQSSQKGPNGGPMEDIVGVDVEMVAKGKTILFNIFDEKSGKAMSAEGFSGSALLVSGSDREAIKLVPDGNALKAEVKKEVAPGSAISITLKNPEGRSGQVKFKT